MSYRYRFALTAFYVFLIGCTIVKPTSNRVDKLPATALTPFGRTQINKNQDQELISSAAHFGFSFDGTECRIITSLPDWLDHNYLQYELDGTYQDAGKRLHRSSKC